MSRAATEAMIPPDVLSRYEAVIGLEVHVQLLTKSKAFCGCSTRFGDPPNTNVCAVCLGLPGALPVLNRRALELAARAALALHCRLEPKSRFARKNYFYPDLPKGYQISMYELPLAVGGFLSLETETGEKRIGITRLHMEEDAAKALHEGFPDSSAYTYIDFNRCGVPLVEIVSEPDMRSPAEAHLYLTKLKQVLEYVEISDCNMEEGSLRCDANASVRLRGAEKFGAKVEVKNLNSFRYLQHALEFEIERQIGVIESGGRIVQETRLWNVAAGRTESMRSKEFAHDYRYFPEPDLLPVTCGENWIREIHAGLPELPDARRERLISAAGITPYHAEVLTASRPLADYFEATVAAGAPPQSAANWISTELLRRLNESGREVSASPVSPAAFAELIRLVEGGEVTAQVGKQLLAKMCETRRGARALMAEEGVSRIGDVAALEQIARSLIEKNPNQAARYRAGNQGMMKFFIGQLMRETKGQADPQAAAEILKCVLDEQVPG